MKAALRTFLCVLAGVALYEAARFGLDPAAFRVADMPRALGLVLIVTAVLLLFGREQWPRDGGDGPPGRKGP
jgi:hypothetical protein